MLDRLDVASPLIAAINGRVPDISRPSLFTYICANIADQPLTDTAIGGLARAAGPGRVLDRL